MADLEEKIFQWEWNLPHDSHLGMLAYAMVQEVATWLNYRNLRLKTEERGGDPALSKLLTLVSVDERAHHSFFRQCFELYLKLDRETSLVQLRRVMNDFAMPAIHEMADSRRRIAQIKALEIFNEDIYYREVYLPLLEALGVDRREMRNRVPVKKSAVSRVLK
jgi:acyl-[acyl-carrier-protein] desaturase